MERVDDEVFERLPEEAKANRWLGAHPAPIDVIEESERRLGMSFPREDREFWLTSNGWKGYYPESVQIFPITAVERFEGYDSGIIESWQEGMDIEEGIDKSIIESTEPVAVSAAYLRATVIIGIGEDSQFILYHPEEYGGGDSKYLMFSTWYPGAFFYPSLSILLSSLLQEFISTEKRRRKIDFGGV